ncbi:MAG: helix-turn-helix domain-containing protein [Cystobacterineae bacterium]|nr:helix-turn-helix domain-containing protein [Cystobacterineae bacterium]
MPIPQKITNKVLECRLAKKWSQLELAKQVGISRQSLISIETGNTLPRMDVALRLAAAFGVRAEALFFFEEETSEIQATLAAESKLVADRETRVVLGEVGARWVAHSIPVREQNILADGFAQKGVSHSRKINVELVGNLESTRKQLLVMGCAPALGLLAGRLAREPEGIRLAWIQGSSLRALEALRRGEVHMAGIHLFDESSGQYNTPAVRKHFPKQKMLLFNFVSWEQGIVVAPGNPLKIRTLLDVCRPKIRFIAREAGSGAQKLFERLLSNQRIRMSEVTNFKQVARGHMEVAHAVAVGGADAGISIRAAALAYGLDFIPLSQERFDFVFPQEMANDLRVERLVDILRSRAFRREVDAMGGYSTQHVGQQLGETPGA